MGYKKVGSAAATGSAAARGEMEGGDAAWSVAVLAEESIYAFRIGCFLHVLHLADNVGMENVFYNRPLGSGSWDE